MPPQSVSERRIAALVHAHGPALLRVARKHSLCLDDAHDAYQRALEIYLRRLDTVDPATEGAWMKVVVRHEAMAVRRGRGESVSREEVDFDARPDDGSPSLEDRLAAGERAARSAEALRLLKPDEATALMLKAGGHSYSEIAERKAWTYTKVNRSVTEGRARFRRTFAALESGDACETLGPALADLARGTASAETMLTLRPHLRHCPACRATVRELRGGRRRAAGWLPIPALLHRLGGSDLVTGLQLAASGGGGPRGLGVAAVVGIAAVAAPPEPVPARAPAPVVREAQARPQPKGPAAVARVARVAAPPVAVPVAASTPAPRPRRAAPHPAPAAELSFERSATVREPASERSVPVRDPALERSAPVREPGVRTSEFQQGEFAP
jgi:RNA polymerase sigma factor (sigma-70 family)